MTIATAKTESYHDQLVREKREEKATINEFVDKLLSIKIEGWKATVDKYADHDNPHAVVFNHAESGSAFYVSMPCQYASRHRKVEARAEWPRDANGGYKSARDWGLHGYNEVDPHVIGFSYTKTAKAITRDFSRRLIPGILTDMADVNAKLSAQATEKASIDGDIAKLTAALPSADVREQSYCNAKGIFAKGDWYLSNYNPDGDSNTVDLKINNLSVENAIAVAKLISTFDRGDS